jgi:hypothetical protein
MVPMTFGGPTPGIVAPATGPWGATGSTDDHGCAFQLDVTPTTVTGHVSCTDLVAYDKKSGALGTATFEIDFTANS